MSVFVWTYLGEVLGSGRSAEAAAAAGRDNAADWASWAHELERQRRGDAAPSIDVILEAVVAQAIIIEYVPARIYASGPAANDVRPDDILLHALNAQSMDGETDSVNGTAVPAQPEPTAPVAAVSNGHGGIPPGIPVDDAAAAPPAVAAEGRHADLPVAVEASELLGTLAALPPNVPSPITAAAVSSAAHADAASTPPAQPVLDTAEPAVIQPGAPEAPTQ